MRIRDPWATLGVPATASSQEIRRAFARKARELHPDVNSSAGAAAAFRELREAYEAARHLRSARRSPALAAPPLTGDPAALRQALAHAFVRLMRRGGAAGAPAEVVVDMPSGVRLKLRFA